MVLFFFLKLITIIYYFYLFMRVLKFVGCKHCVGPAHLLVKTHLWACLLKPTKSALWFNAKLSMHGKVWLLLMRSDAKLPKSACHSLGNDLGVWDTLKLKRKKKKENRGHSALSEELKHREQFGQFLCEFQREQNTEKREFQLRCAVRKIERNTVRVWKSEKEKWDFFFSLSYTKGR